MSKQASGFTLFEVLIALAVFALAVVGIAKALDSALGAALEARRSGQCRQQLESRLAFCLADPPQPGSPRILEADHNHGVRVEETVEPVLEKNAKGDALQGLEKLTIRVRSGEWSDMAEILMNRP